jgi:hypothetical protein
MPAPSTLALFALAAPDCGYAIAAGAAAKRLGGFRHGRQVTGVVSLALGATAALIGGRR